VHVIVGQSDGHVDGSPVWQMPSPQVSIGQSCGHEPS
jgi:hypothetical protein